MSLDTWKQLASNAIVNWKQKLSPTLVNAKTQTRQLLTHIKPSRANNLVGIDIGTDYLRLAKISQNDGNLTIDSLAILPMPAGAIVKDEIKDPASIVALLKDLLRQTGIETNETALAISRSSAIIKNIHIDNRLAPDEIESRAWIEANRLFPDLVGNIYLDFSVSEPLANDNTQREMTLVACRKDVINPYLDILQQAGLKACIVDVNCYALERALPLTLSAADNLTTVALLNLNLHMSTLLVTHEGALVYAHDQSYDGLRLKNLVEAYLKTKAIPSATPTGAEVFSTPPTGEETSSATPFGETIPAATATPSVDDASYMAVLTENLSSHLRHTMHFFFSSRPNINIQKIILAGECANIKHLNVLIQQETGIETIVANPLLNLRTGPNVNVLELKNHQTALMQCFGLAMAKSDGGH